MKNLFIALLVSIAFVSCEKYIEPSCEGCYTEVTGNCGKIIELGYNIEGCEFDYLILEKYGYQTYLVCLDKFESGLFAVGANYCEY